MAEPQEAVDALMQFGLTEYEARCFVALTQLPHGTAKEIGQVADIPRSRVYETMDRLYDKGLVALHNAEPKEYQAISIDRALDKLRAEYDSYFETAEEALRDLEPTYKKAEQGVWAINTHDQVTSRVVDLLEDADGEIVLVVLDEDLLDETTLDALQAADERGVSLYVGTDSETVHDPLGDVGLADAVFTTDLVEWFTAMEGSPRIGRLLMVDRGPILASALHEEELPGVPNETAAWTDGVDHGFATFAERVLTYELQREVDVELQ
ncbi:TrmB family transcriptional regulator [Natronomonas salina]|uniref:TrmB family transcriptional regulator n=1 Tax=Natronomonas salina TaxID=1710540 RepID=UPI0015B5AB55|nr:helix-turn-helix domain-containing protein [Natronomonas salina]QLD88825.1 TrmB family transcriptional regulator [Natronomonas salina]